MLEDESMPSNAMPANLPSSLEFTLGCELYFTKESDSLETPRGEDIYI